MESFRSQMGLEKLTSRVLRKNRGSVLLFSVFLMIVAFGLGIMLVQSLPGSYRVVERVQRHNLASEIARGGVLFANDILVRQVTNSPGVNPLIDSGDGNPNLIERELRFHDGWVCRVRITPDPVVDNTALPAYIIESQALRDLGGSLDPVVGVRCGVMQVSTNSMALIIDSLQKNSFFYSEPNDDPLRGTIHTNGPMQLWLSKDFYSNQPGDKPLYTGGVSFSTRFRKDEVKSSPYAAQWDNRRTLTASPDDVYWMGMDGTEYRGYSWRDVPPFEYDPNGDGTVDSAEQVENYKKIASSGKSDIKWRKKADADTEDWVSDYIELPPVDGELADKALATDGSLDASSLASSSPAVIVNSDSSGRVTGGIYINSDVLQMDMLVGKGNPLVWQDPDSGLSIDFGEGNQVCNYYLDGTVDGSEGKETSRNSDDYFQVIEVTDEPVRLPSGIEVDGTVLTSPLSVGTDRVIVRDDDGKYSILDGNLNGLTFVDGNIAALEGMSKGAKTVAVPNTQSADKGGKGNIRISGEILDYETVPGMPPASSQSILGLIGHDMFLDNIDIASRYGPNQEFYMYMDVMVGDSNANVSYPEDKGGFRPEKTNHRDYLNVAHFGSRACAYFHSWGYVTSSGDKWGATEVNIFPERNRSTSPPFFPTLNEFRYVFYENFIL